jgi:molybdopterin adenylyltransferase
MGHDKHDHDGDHDHGHGHAGQGHGGHGSKAAQEHKSHAPAQVAAFVVTCSDSRDEARDESGAAIRSALEGAGHTVAGYRLIRDEPSEIQAALDAAAAAGARAVIFNGGTGIGRRDNTIEVLEAAFEKRLPGFGELFRALSYEEIGSPAMLSRACAGTVGGMIVFAVPGSPQAAGLAMRALILRELGHLVRELTR